MRWLFLFAYLCSGFAGLTYEVSWTRPLTLHIGHTIAAASAVVAAFLGGLAVGAAAGGAVSSRLAPRQALRIYVALELGVAMLAIVLPFELTALEPVLAWAYNDGTPGMLFPAIRLLSCLVMVFVPASALGATFPMAVRWFAVGSSNPPRSSGALYALNTAGAAVGALLAGFVLIPAVGLSGTTLVAMAGSAVAALIALAISSLTPEGRDLRRATKKHRSVATGLAHPWLPGAVLGLSGFAALIHEIAWTRILALVFGPTIYAFAATLAAVIVGVAVGSGVGTWIVGQTKRPAAWLALTLAGAAITTSITYSLAGGEVPRVVAEQLAAAPSLFDQLIRQGAIITATLIVPTAALVGAAFPLALAAAAGGGQSAEPQAAFIYAINTVGAVAGSLAAGFVFIPRLGPQTTLQIVSGSLIAAVILVVMGIRLASGARALILAALGAALVILAASPPWDRELLASGAYLYAPFVPKNVDLETLLKAGTLLYYREGAASTVSVKRLTGTTTLAVDGKTDASNRGDMLTQKLIAHLPLLLHEAPRNVAIIGLGSGVTLGSALTHPIARADVIEISPQVVEASEHFRAENHHALEDPRANLILGDGRSHLVLSKREYDVIISEPSNPWIAGVASLFTREFFLAARGRLASHGVICQWANAYNISDQDLRSIVATFISVFPDGTAWLVGADDVLFVGSADSDWQSMQDRFGNIERHWNRPGVAADLREVLALEPFALWSLFVAGPSELERYAAGAPLITDNRMTLEFSAPRALHGWSGGDAAAALAALVGQGNAPSLIRQAKASVTVAEWRRRADMMMRRDAPSIAYDDYVHALPLDSNDPAALAWIKALTRDSQTADALIAISKLLAAIGANSDAVDAARQATRARPVQAKALEQLASLFADEGDTAQLDATVDSLMQASPNDPATYYYGAVSRFLHGNAADAVEYSTRAIAIDANYAPVYDLLGAAYTKLDQPAAARDAFQTSLRLDAHDSTAYTNLGLLELASGDRAAARRYFAEALWLAPDEAGARQGLAQSQ